MLQEKRRASPRTVARVTGVLCVLEGGAALFGQMVLPRMLVVPGDAVATAGRIAGDAMLMRVSLLLGLLAVAFHTAATVLMYELFRPASRSGARHFACFSLVMLSLQAGSCLLQLPAMDVLAPARGDGGAASQSLALVFMTARSRAFNLYLAFFGIRCALLGHLVLRSTFMPRPIGALLLITGLGYAVHLWAPLAGRLHPFHLLLAAPGELSLVLWLLVAGVHPGRWREQARGGGGVAVAAGGIPGPA